MAPEAILEHMRAASAVAFNADPENAYEPRHNFVFSDIYSLKDFNYHWVNSHPPHPGQPHLGAGAPFTNCFNAGRMNPIPDVSSAIRAKGKKPVQRI